MNEVGLKENGIVREEDSPLFLSGKLTHTHSFRQCFVMSLHNMDTHQWPVGKLTEQEACACTWEHVCARGNMSCICLCTQNA